MIRFASFTPVASALVALLLTNACGTPERASNTEALAAARGECYVVADGDDSLYVVDASDPNPATNATQVGDSGVADIEAIALDPIDAVLYAADDGQLGTLDVDTGAFTARPQSLGTGRGALGNIALDDIDGLTFDLCTGRLYGSHRRAGFAQADLLVVIDRISGALVANAFGPGLDYVPIDPVLGLSDIDDIAVDPNCQMFGVANGAAADRLVRIDERDGSTEDVGALGVADVEGLAVDPAGQLFGSTGIVSPTTGFVRVDSGTGVASAVLPLDESNDYEAIACLADIDTDSDGIPDIGERVLGSDPVDADSDDDGVTDGDEPAPRGDTDGDGLGSVLDPDSDNDGLADGTELGIATAGADTDEGSGNFRPDADPSTTTDPLASDSDGGGVADGAEDVNHDGRADDGETNANQGADDSDPADADGDGLGDDEERRIGSDPEDADSDDDGVLDGLEANAGFDTDGDGLQNVLDPDSDDDLLADGTESGVTMAASDTNLDAGNFRADADPSTTTFALVADSDRGGVRDGTEDTDKDGDTGAAEIDPNERRDDAQGVVDADADGLSDSEELGLGTDADDADTDDDGVLDGDESNGALDTDLDGVINILDPDSDGDGLTDGVERGVFQPSADTDVSADVFAPDFDPATTTSMVDADSDDGGAIDGAEDENGNGRVDFGERDPNDPSDDMASGDDDGDGIDNDADNCPQVANTDQADSDGDGEGDACEGLDIGGGGCAAGTSSGLCGALLLVSFCAWRRRRRRNPVS